MYVLLYVCMHVCMHVSMETRWKQMELCDMAYLTTRCSWIKSTDRSTVSLHNTTQYVTSTLYSNIAYICMYIQAYIYIYVYMYMYIYMYIYIYILWERGREGACLCVCVCVCEDIYFVDIEYYFSLTSSSCR